jgi:MerR family transcriptional regulator, light-induced transcriptional regulator
METPRYTTQTAARLSGLSVFVLRAWEKRYSVVKPQRTSTNRRLYSDADVERLVLLRKLTEAGLAISSAAPLTDTELRTMLRRVEELGLDDNGEGMDPAGWRAGLMRRTRQLDGTGLERMLREAERTLPRRVFIDHVVAPFLGEIGSGWREGRVRIVQEHLATTTIRSVIVDLLNAATAVSGAQRVITATPSGQVHEMGALLAGLAASTMGHAVTHLGADLPAEEIAHAARDLDAAEVLISIVYPPDDATTFAELVELVRLLPTGVGLVVGGASAPAYLARIDHPSLMHIESTADLWEHYASPISGT